MTFKKSVYSIFFKVAKKKAQSLGSSNNFSKSLLVFFLVHCSREGFVFQVNFFLYANSSSLYRV